MTIEEISQPAIAGNELGVAIIVLTTFIGENLQCFSFLEAETALTAFAEFVFIESEDANMQFLRGSCFRCNCFPLITPLHVTNLFVKFACSISTEGRCYFAEISISKICHVVYRFPDCLEILQISLTALR